MTAGNVGRLSSISSILDEDDFVLKRNNTIYRVSATTLAAYIVAENSTTREITFSDSPYTIASDDEFINVDATGGSVIINFLPLATAPKKPIYIRKNAGGANTVTLTPDGSDQIDGASSLVITTDGNAEMCVPYDASWRTH